MIAKKLYLVFYIFLFFSYSEEGLAWGKKGHRIIGAVASEYLDFKAVIKIKKLLGDDSLADASTWADSIRSSDKEEYKKFLPWHYVTILAGTDYDSLSSKAEGDAYLAIIKIFKELNNTSFETMIETSKNKKYFRMQLKLLIHFVSDLHQPLHVGNGKDKGGNLCLVNYFNQRASLHRVWDSLMIEKNGYSYTEFTKYLLSHYSKKAPKLKAKWSLKEVRRWMDESNKVRSNLYPKSVDGKRRSYCVKSFSKLDQLKNDKNFLKKLPNISYKYNYKFDNLLKSKLFLSGFRLAKMLNILFSK